MIFARRRESLLQVTAVLLSLAIAVESYAFPFASGLRKGTQRAAQKAATAEKQVKKKIYADVAGHAGGVGRSANYQPIRNLITIFAHEKLQSGGAINSLEELVRKVDTELYKVQFETDYRPYGLDEQSVKLLKQGVSSSFIRDNVREMAMRYGVLATRKGVGAKPHPAREDAYKLLNRFRFEGLERYEAINRLEMFYQSSHLPYTAPSHSSVKRWAAEIYRR